MEAKPVITIHGELDLIGPVTQKTFQTKLKSLQRDDYSKEEKAFASFCQGVEFKEFWPLYKSRSSPSHTYFVHREPCLHTFWTGAYEHSVYISSVKPNIDQWINNAAAIGDDDKLLIVFCVTAEVRSKRSKLKGTKLGGKYETIEELIVKEYRGRCNVTNLRLASADSSRVSDSFNSFAVEINRLALNNFLSRVSVVDNQLRNQRIRQVEKEEVYELICKKLSLCICYEMIRDPLQASTRYSVVHNNFEFSMTNLSKEETLPSWLSQLQIQEIRTWNCPNLTDTLDSWKYLPDIFANRAHILHIWTFMFVRRIQALCGCGLVQEVYRCCVQTLHCTARLINTMKLSLPAGVFNSWAYMCCIECVESMMIKIDPEVLAKTSSATLILVRAELWHYAWEKLRSIGMLCHLMPSSQFNDVPEHAIISTICSGITSTSSEEVNAIDQGSRLVEVLQSKEKFKNAFMSLGEMVIGAFKHAGRRRMAFSIGTRMAEFHKEVGMVKEAEQLLCDVTSLHSVQHWPQLSSSAYSILAHCQKKLRQEEKEVNSLLVLVTTPKHDNSAHDPSHYMEQLIRIADTSKYQKLLSWEPLFDLECLSFTSSEYHRGEEIELKITFNYSGPMSMKFTMVTAILEPDNRVHSVSMVADKSMSLVDGLETLREIELEPGPAEEELLASRPVGGDLGSKLHKVYYSSSNLADGQDVVRTSGCRLVTREVNIEPAGTNSTVVKGKIMSPGQYTIQQILLKKGALDFCLVVPMATADQHMITVLPDKVNMSIGLKPQHNIILSGVPVLCELQVITGEETTINEGAELSLMAPPTVQLETIDGDLPDDYHQLLFNLPSLSSANDHCLPFDMTVTSLYQTAPPSLGCRGNGGGDLLAWQFELEVYCNWLTPTHVARLPLMVYEPFSFSHKECSAGESTFLQITMVNSCPLPLKLERHTLSTSLKLLPIGGQDIPEVFYPGDTLSLIWKHNKPKGGNTGPLIVSPACFKVDYYPQTASVTSQVKGKALSRTAEYNLSLSNMETIYHVKTSVESVLPRHPISVNQHVFITYIISNITRDFRDSAHQPHPDRLHYTIQADSTHWIVTSPKKGVVDAPGIARSVSFKITATPKEDGQYLPPSCTLVLEKLPRPELNETGTDTIRGGARAATEGERVTLTNAQYYHTTQQQYISVLEGTRQPF